MNDKRPNHWDCQLSGVTPCKECAAYDAAQVAKASTEVMDGADHDPRPEDIPADTDPVCRLCKLPAVWDGSKWTHATEADAAFCSLVFRGMI